MKKILLIQFKQIGDLILTTQLPRELHKIFPDAEIDFLTFPMNFDLLKHNPHVRNVITASPKSTIFQTIKSVMGIHKNKYDIVIDTQNTPRSMYYVMFSNAAVKVGFEESKRKNVYNTRVSRHSSYAGYVKLNTLKPFDTEFSLEKYDVRPEVFFSNDDNKNATKKLTEVKIDPDKPYITISPTHKRDTRRWKFRHFMDTANWLADEKGLQVVLTCAPNERKYIEEEIEDYNKPINENIKIAPDMSLTEFAAVVSKAKMHIGNDSAPHHLAVSQSTPTFIITGSTTDVWIHPAPMHTYASMNLECQPCGKSTCKISEDVPCMEEFTFEMIKPKLEQFINEYMNK